MIRRISQKRLEREFGGKMPNSTVGKSGASKRDEHRKLNGMGLDRRSDEDEKAEALAEVERAQAFVRSRACIVTGKRTGEYDDSGAIWGRRIQVEAAHIKGRGAWGADIGNMVPLDARLHRGGAGSLHQLGPTEFQKRYKVNLRAAANATLAAYEAEKGVPTL